MGRDSPGGNGVPLRQRRWIVGSCVCIGFLGLGSGCRTAPTLMLVQAPVVAESNPGAVPDLPRELNKVTLPPYIVESPDVLTIEGLRIVPLAAHRVEPRDVLQLFAPNAPERDPINALFPVAADGSINLGTKYGGAVRVADKTLLEVEAALAQHLAKFLKKPAITVTLAQARGVRELRGEHPVQPDGTVSLGSYGAVYVAGMTIPKLKLAIEQHLSKSLDRPEVSVEVFASNSKFYYVVTDVGGGGERVVRFPATGNETVLDAIALIGGLPPALVGRLWIARPAPAGSPDQILPVDWNAVSRRGATATNYQLLPGDRLFVSSHP